MAHKKIERKKELDRRRKRRAERIKARIHGAVLNALGGASRCRFTNTAAGSAATCLKNG